MPLEDGEHEGLYAVLLCRVVGGRTKVVTNNDINIVPHRTSAAAQF